MIKLDWGHRIISYYAYHRSNNQDDSIKIGIIHLYTIFL